MRTLQEIWDNLPSKSDKGDVHSYLPLYEERLAPYRHSAVNVLEIGLFNGASLKLWEEYFTMANVYGIDCDEQPHGGMADLRPMILSGQHNIIICDATNEKEIEKHFKGIKFEVVIEDASHNIEQQVKIFNVLKPYMNEGGIYCIEDIKDIDKTKWIFESISSNKVEILDRRNIKNRYDDVMVLIHF